MQVYKFKNKDLFAQCFVHKSKNMTTNYETLEWIGDSVLKLVISMVLTEYHKEASVKTLNELRVHLEKNDTLAEICKRLKWTERIQLGANQQVNTKMQADVIEAVLYAVFKDSNYDIFAVKRVYTAMYFLLYPQSILL